MKKTIFAFTAGLLFMGVNVFAYDVSIDSEGNVETGIFADGNLEVTGSSGQYGIIGYSSGTAAGAVYGKNTTSGNYGILGYDSYAVYGFSSIGYAGYFWGNVTVTGDLNVAGTFSANELDPVFSSWDKSAGISITESQISNLDHFTNANEIDPVFMGSPSFGITSGLISNWNTAYGWGDHSTEGYDTSNDSWTGTGNVYVTSGSVGIGTATPSSRLEIAGNGYPFSFLTFNGIGGTNDTGMRFNTNGSVRWHFFNQGSTDLLTLRRESNYGTPVIAADYTSGNVGIGTLAPSEKLTVAGTIQSTSGGIKFPDSTIQTTAADSSWHQKLPVEERFVLVLDDAAVLDKETGLVWEQSPSTSLYSWIDAIHHCYDLYIGGRKGWHLPTVEQLTSVLDPTESYPPLPIGHPFVNVTGAVYWTSTIYEDNDAYVWGVGFASSDVNYTVKSGAVWAWCVR